MSINKEFRAINQPVTADESRKVEGYAVVFNSESEDLGFTEVIRPSAITPETLKRSDVFAKFNHDDNKILARCRYGAGSLTLTLDDRGLKYQFEAPHTAVGDELLEYLKRGDIFASSFAFSVDKTKGEKWSKRDGKFYREITEITNLYDVAPVFSPAYSATSCCKRFAEIQTLSDEIEKSLSGFDAIADDFGKEILTECRAEIRGLSDDEIKYFAEIREKLESEKTTDEAETDDEAADSEAETNTIENDTQTESEKSENDQYHTQINTNEATDNEASETTDEAETEDEKVAENKTDNKRKLIYKNTMNNKFSLLRSIRNVVNNKAFEAVDSAVINAGQSEMRKAGVNAVGQIQLPANELRAISVETEGEDVVATDVLDVLTPLMAKQVLNELGARQMGGLVGDVLVPVMSSANANFVAETADAALDTNIGFTSVKLSPKRLSTVVAVSKQFIMQDGAGAEAAIRQNIIDSLAAKFQSVVLGSAAGTATQPAGLFNVNTPEEITDFETLTDFEAKAEEANVYDCKYLLSPKAKAALRNMARGASHVGNVFENGEVDGTKAVAVSDVKDTFIAYGDFSNCIYGAWGGGVDLCIDPYSLASQGLIRLVSSVYVDFVNARPEAIKIGKIVKPAASTAKV